MKTQPRLARWLALVFLVAAMAASNAYAAPDLLAMDKPSEPIPWKELGKQAGAQYQGDGLSIIPTKEYALIRCVFQRLQGQVTREGL